MHAYQQMVQAIDELVRKTFQDWTSTLDKDCIRRLDTPLLRVSQEKAGMLDVNFDKYGTQSHPFPCARLSPAPLPAPRSPEALRPCPRFLAPFPLRSLSYAVICVLSLPNFSSALYLQSAAPGNPLGRRCRRSATRWPRRLS